MFITLYSRFRVRSRFDLVFLRSVFFTQKSRIFAPSQPGKTCLDEGNTAFYRVIRSHIFRVLMTLFGKITPYNKITEYGGTRSPLGGGPCLSF